MRCTCTHTASSSLAEFHLENACEKASKQAAPRTILSRNGRRLERTTRERIVDSARISTRRSAIDRAIHSGSNHAVHSRPFLSLLSQNSRLPRQRPRPCQRRRSASSWENRLWKTTHASDFVTVLTVFFVTVFPSDSNLVNAVWIGRGLWRRYCVFSAGFA